MTAGSATWNIERIWSVTTKDKTEQSRTADLSRLRAVVMLGAAGSGKTTEAARLARQERAAGASVRECRLAEFAETTTELAEHLAGLAKGANERTVFYLDALDEAMIPARRRWLAIKHWITGELQGTGASVRVTCRSAVWPPELTQVIGEFAGEQSFATALLHSLDDDDILAVAKAHGIDGAAFLERIHRSGARSLAGQPLALRMLMRLHQSSHGLPASLNDLFQKGLELLVSDPHERREIDTQNPISPHALLEAAERLACYMVLSGRETVHLGDEPPLHQLGLHDLSGKVTPKELGAIGLSGICDSTSPPSFRFGHRQFAEFLAGRRLAMLPTHQARAFLASTDGWNNGVAGPLRETAAFSAMFNAEVADWIAARDPEVIGLSDVADSSLRRKATLALFDRFRRAEMTDAQLWPGEIELRGLRYHDAAVDLRPVLRETHGDGEDAVKFAIRLAGSWRISSLSDDLADIALDTTVSLQIRTHAGHALSQCGAASTKKRLKPLVAGVPEDDSDELKGIALDCNWPDRLSALELLDALTPGRRQSFSGTYCVFLWRLDEEQFSATGHRVAGLRWAKTRISELGDVDVLHRIATRIAHAALRDMATPGVARALVELVRQWAKHYKSPLAALSKDTLERESEHELDQNAPLRADREARRRLIDELVSAVETRQELVGLVHQTPGLLNAEDFLWLLQEGCDDDRNVAERANYLHVTSQLPWERNPDNVDAWLGVCDSEPVRTILGNQKSVELHSEEATQLREHWEKYHRRTSSEAEVPTLDPSPHDGVLNALDVCENKDIRHFPPLCLELVLEPTGTHYGVGERFLTTTPGWRDAAPETRNRILKAAKAYLSKDGLVAEAADAVSPNTSHVGVFEAIWLILERDPGWLVARTESWWNEWCWYMLRELVPNMAGEPAEPKQQIVAVLNEKSPQAVCREIVALAGGRDKEYADLLSDLLALLRDEQNAVLDKRLCRLMRVGAIVQRHVPDVAAFVLARAQSTSIPICLEILENALAGTGETRAEDVAVALLRRRAGESWDSLRTFLRSDADRGQRVLRRFAYGEESDFMESMSVRQLGELTEVLLEMFPPETDRESEGVSAVTPDDSARTLRDRMIPYLSKLENSEAVEVLRRLERRFMKRYPWLRRPRSEAERAFRLSRWSPCPIDVIENVLDAGERRLICSEDDVVDGIEYALERYGTALGGDAGDSAEDLWNTAKSEAPTPKAEEHVSSKLCAAVRSYFGNYAVAADREVEIHRRSVARGGGGEPGSEVDLLVQVPGCGAASGDAIRVPIEVKLSSNDDARTGIREQLADRYIPQLGATHGVYVVVWMSLPRPEELQEHHRPKWRSIESARQELREEAERLWRKRGIRVRTIVVDGSLR